MTKEKVKPSHFDAVAANYDEYKVRNKFYYNNLKSILSAQIPKNSKVLDFGCGTGDLIFHLSPKYGYGYDTSRKMIAIAKNKYPSINFSVKLPEEKFDYIFMSDVIEHLDNPAAEFKKISKLMSKNSMFICTMANPIWEPALLIAEKLKLKMPEGKHKRLSFRTLKIIVENTELKINTHGYKLLMPIKIPFITSVVNKYLEPHLKKFCFIEFFTAKL